MDLIPQPRKLSRKAASFTLPANCAIVIMDDCPRETLLPAQQLATEIEVANCRRPALLRSLKDEKNSLVLSLKPKLAAEAYELSINKEGVCLRASTAAGFYYGVQTLRQIVRSCGRNLPCLEIEDSPDYAARGFYHDATRGKVPSLETLFALVEKMAHYKMNQLQLYVEHTFAFRKHPDVWAGSDPLTAEEILALDEHCRKHHVELVPSLSTFGHMYMMLRSPRKEHLNELSVNGSEKAFSFHERMAHYTLDPSNNGSLELVKEILDEFVPLFRSKYFNICCDETFDLGKGRNKEKAEKIGGGKLYIEFLLKVMSVLRKNGKQPMFWGDIVLHFPELIKELPKDAIALHWDYSAEPNEERTLKFSKAKVPYYVCPGVSGWNRLFNAIEYGSANISNFAMQGKKLGAIGFLNTDWGDYGHVNLLANSYHGMILGAAWSWRTSPETGKSFDEAFSRLELGDCSGQAAGVLKEIGLAPVLSWGAFQQWLDPSSEIAAWYQPHPVSGAGKALLETDNAKLVKAYKTLVGLRGRLSDIASYSCPADKLVFREMLCGAWGETLIQAACLLLQEASGGKKAPKVICFDAVADEIRLFEQEISALWHLRNKPSEYYRIRQVLLLAAERLDRFAKLKNVKRG
ncbi:MAG: hypothetical protein A2X49_12140 [Lentisphaerae bacterium GWF2_52_8]|nr:MAG: hypothetical protein A2X49_12140 [Lentisphaerae bacterium GWF2_52_8]